MSINDWLFCTHSQVLSSINYATLTISDLPYPLSQGIYRFLQYHHQKENTDYCDTDDIRFFAKWIAPFRSRKAKDTGARIIFSSILNMIMFYPPLHQFGQKTSIFFLSFVPPCWLTKLFQIFIEYISVN